MPPKESQVSLSCLATLPASNQTAKMLPSSSMHTPSAQVNPAGNKDPFAGCMSYDLNRACTCDLVISQF